jgi:DNA-binding beta-propeller fold protein YncE
LLFSKGLKIPLILSIPVIIILFFMFLLSSNLISIPSAEARYVFTKTWGEPGSGPGQFGYPLGIVIDSSYRVYVADYGNNRIQLFRLASPCPTGTILIVPGVCFVKSWGSFGTASGQFKSPSHIALDSSGRVYVADYGNHRVQMFKGNGIFMKTWDRDGPGTAQFLQIAGIAVDASTNDIYVVERNGGADMYLHKFRLANPCPTGTTQVTSGICFVGKTIIGDSSQPPHQSYSASGATVDSLTHGLFISMFESNGHERYFVSGTNHPRLGDEEGSADGKFSTPIGITVAPSGTVYVADSGNNRIQKFLLSNPCPAGTTQIKPGVCFVTKWGGLSGVRQHTV